MKPKSGTKAHAKNEAKKCLRSGAQYYIYQFPSTEVNPVGRWSWASSDSPIGEKLRTEGYIYPGIKAASFSLETITEESSSA